MELSQIVIILCHPISSQNIGSVCRAMLNMGISKLRLVGEKTDYDKNQIKKLSIHAHKIWLSTTFYDSLEQATTDCVLTAGTTRRKGKHRKTWFYYPEEFAQKASTLNSGLIAVVFGNERTGLTDNELNVCSLGITIPSDKKFSSLNLSHAVQIITYALYTKKNSFPHSYSPITVERTNKAVGIITKTLDDSSILKISEKQTVELYWKSIISRATMSESEVVYLENLFRKIAGKYKKISEKNNVGS